MSRGGVQVKPLAPKYQTWGKRNTKHLIAFAVQSVMYVFSIWARAIGGKQIQAVWKKAHMAYRAIHASAQGGKIPPVSWQMFCVSLQGCSPNRFQKLSSVSRIKGEANDFFLALFICPCQIKYFPHFSLSEGQKIIFFSQKIKTFGNSYFWFSIKGIQYNFIKLEIKLPSGIPVYLNSIYLLQCICPKKHDGVCLIA